MSDEIKRLRDQLARIQTALCDTRPKQAVGEMVEHAITLAAELEAQVSMLRTGDTCARLCEGTAYRIEARQLKKRVGELEARAGEAVAWMLEWTHSGDERGQRLYDDERHCLLDAETDGGVCVPLGRIGRHILPTGDAAGKDSVDAARIDVENLKPGQEFETGRFGRVRFIRWDHCVGQRTAEIEKLEFGGRCNPLPETLQNAIDERQADAVGPTHASDCDVHNEPAKPNGPCDCGASK